jgi:hypothetical protein
MLYERETRAPLVTVFDTSNDAEISQVMDQWFLTKTKEANYAQIAVSPTTHQAARITSRLQPRKSVASLESQLRYASRPSFDH